MFLSRLYLSHLRLYVPYKYWTLEIIASLSRTAASYALPVRQASDLPAASFRFYLAIDTLAVRLTIPLIRLVWNFHPIETRHAGHTIHRGKRPVSPGRGVALTCHCEERQRQSNLVFKSRIAFRQRRTRLRRALHHCSLAMTVW